MGDVAMVHIFFLDRFFAIASRRWWDWLLEYPQRISACALILPNNRANRRWTVVRVHLHA